MQSKQLVQLRQLSTSRHVLRPALSAEYKSKQLWNKRFECKILSDTNLIKSINSRILMDMELSSLEMDVFVNITAPQSNEIAQLQEAAKALSKFRRSLHAHRLLPSTAHATCRLFLDSGRLPSLINLLEDRVNHGIFPDWFTMNLIFDQALESGNYSLASRAAALIMIQEEFGLNEMSDKFSLYSVAKYIEERSNFDEWLKWNKSRDPIFTKIDQAKIDAEDANQAKETNAEQNEAEEETEEDDEDAEYIRIPWLRNKYFDNHFDLTNPRQICGRTLFMIGNQLKQSSDELQLATHCKLLGSVLEGNWSLVDQILEDTLSSGTKLDIDKELLKYYIENLHDVQEPEAGLKSKILSNLNQLPESKLKLSDLVEQRCSNFPDLERREINQLNDDLKRWTDLRQAILKEQDEIAARKQLIEEIKAKKRELELKEQYLYFYDNLKKNNLTRVAYD